MKTKLTKKAYAQEAVKSLKKLHYVTNVEAVGNQKTLCLNVYWREKQNKPAFKEVKEIVLEQFKRLFYTTSQGCLGPTKAGYIYHVAIFEVLSNE